MMLLLSCWYMLHDRLHVMQMRKWKKWHSTEVKVQLQDVRENGCFQDSKFTNEGQQKAQEVDVV